MNKSDLAKIQDDILGAMLSGPHFGGWTEENAAQACATAGHTPSMLRAAFPGGLRDIVATFSSRADQAMLQSLKSSGLSGLPVRERIAAAILARFDYLEAHRDAMKEALAYWSIPSRKIAAAKIVWRTADHIWLWAGDTATDYNRLTKRILLSGILVASMLAWLNGAGQDRDALKAFIDRRIARVMQLNKMLAPLKKSA